MGINRIIGNLNVYYIISSNDIWKDVRIENWVDMAAEFVMDGPLNHWS